jgi:hypothetical protein
MRIISRCVVAMSLLITCVLLLPSTANAGWLGRVFGTTEHYKREAIKAGVPRHVAATRARQLNNMRRTLDRRHCADADLARHVWMRSGNLQQSLRAGRWQRLGPNE